MEFQEGLALSSISVCLPPQPSAAIELPRLLKTDGVDTTSLTTEHLHEVFVLRMPFRLRTGAFLRLKVMDPIPCDVCFVNRIAVPVGADVLRDPELNGCLLQGLLWTDVLIDVPNPDLCEGEIQRLRCPEEATDREFFPLDESRQVDALNRCITAYHTASGETMGGRPLSLFTWPGWHPYLRYNPIIACRPGRVLSDDELLKWCLAPQPEPSVIRGEGLSVDLSDLPDDTIDAIPEALEQVCRHAFHESAFAARLANGLWNPMPMQALLNAIIALEGAHSVFLHSRLEPRLGAMNGKQWDEVEEFARVLGLSKLMSLTPALFMTPDEMPSKEAIRECCKAISKRNEIMHAVRTRAGLYKSRLSKQDGLGKHIKAALDMYEHYRRLIA